MEDKYLSWTETAQTGSTIVTRTYENRCREGTLDLSVGVHGGLFLQQQYGQPSRPGRSFVAVDWNWN